MEYDRVKARLEAFIGSSAIGRKLFFAALDRLFLRARYIRRELHRLRKSGFSPNKILDAGSGFGQYSFHMAKLFPNAEVIGLDVKSEIVTSGNRLAKQFGIPNITFEVGDLLSLEYPSQFDLVLNVDVLEHIEDDQLVIQNIARVLKPNGIFLLTTPYFDGSSPGSAAFVDEHVRSGYSREDLKTKLHAAGLRLEKFTITYGIWGGIAWKLLQKWPMTWLTGRNWLIPLVALYVCTVYPIAWIFMQLDMLKENDGGGGILATAIKMKNPVNH